VHKYLRGAGGKAKGGGIKLFSEVSSDRAGGGGHKFKYRLFCLNIRKNFFNLRLIKHGSRLHREIVESPYLEIFKI